MAHVLVVDDEDQMRKLIRIILVQEGHSVVEALNGKMAIEQIKASGVQLVITDVVMPDMDGLELIRFIRKTSSQTKIIAISGAGREGPDLYLNIAEQFGADAILMKPFTSEQLIEKVSALVPV
jgi:CheY-like chemotaxis protein